MRDLDAVDGLSEKWSRLRLIFLDRLIEGAIWLGFTKETTKSLAILECFFGAQRAQTSEICNVSIDKNDFLGWILKRASKLFIYLINFILINHCYEA